MLEKTRQHSVKAVEENVLRRRQNYNRAASRLAAQIGRYAHATQFMRMLRAVRMLRTRVGRMHREVARQLPMLPGAVKAKGTNCCSAPAASLSSAPRTRTSSMPRMRQRWSAPAEARPRPYEFDVKISIATTLKEGLVVSMRSMPANP